MRFIAFVLALASSSAGCGTDEEPIVLVNGAACLWRTDGEVPTRLEVWFDGCEPCAAAQEESCQVTRDGNVISVTATAVYEPLGEGICTADCRTPIVPCDLPALEDGTYELRFDGGSAPFKLPLDDHVCAQSPALNSDTDQAGSE